MKFCSLSVTVALFGFVTNVEQGEAFVPFHHHHSRATTTSTRRTAFAIRPQTTSTTLAASSSDAGDNELDVECLVLGGGISGSTLAHNLNRSGIDMVLAEARDYLGGNVKSHKTDDGFIWEEGPNSFATQPSIVRIAYELGIDDQLVFADESLPPWVNHNGKLHPLPKGQGGKGPKGQIELVFGPNGVLKFALAGELLSWPGKIRAGIGAFLGHAPPPEGKEETIRDWVERILGEEVFLRCIDPFVSGVYAGNPETLSMKAALPKIARIENISYSIGWNKFGAIFYGGLKRQFELTKERKADPPAPEWPEFEYGNPGSFKEGLSTLPKAIHAELGDKIKLQWKATKIEKTADGGYKTTFETPSGERVVNSKTLVSTVPAHSLSNVLQPVMPESKEIFEKGRWQIDRTGIYHPPVAAVTVAYPKSSFKDVELPNGFGNLQNLPGFGSLNPRTEGVRTLGTLWSSSLFPGRAPPDYNLLLNYIGGSRDVALSKLSEEEIIDEVDKGCRQVLLKPDAPKPKVLGLKVWPTAIPQYELGHLPLMKELEEAESKLPGLWVCGNYRTGVAFPDCVTYGYEHAKIVKAFLDGDIGSDTDSDAATVTTTTTDDITRSAESVITTVEDKEEVAADSDGKEETSEDTTDDKEETSVVAEEESKDDVEEKEEEGTVDDAEEKEEDEESTDDAEEKEEEEESTDDVEEKEEEEESTDDAEEEATTDDAEEEKEAADEEEEDEATIEEDEEEAADENEEEEESTDDAEEAEETAEDTEAEEESTDDAEEGEEPADEEEEDENTIEEDEEAAADETEEEEATADDAEEEPTDDDTEVEEESRDDVEEKEEATDDTEAEEAEDDESSDDAEEQEESTDDSEKEENSDESDEKEDDTKEEEDTADDSDKNEESTDDAVDDDDDKKEEEAPDESEAKDEEATDAADKEEKTDDTKEVSDDGDKAES